MVTPRYPGTQPIPTAETAHYWRAALRGPARVQYCRDCARHQFYPRAFCTRCLSRTDRVGAASGRGTHLHLHGVPRRRASGFEADGVPYAIGHGRARRGCAHAGRHRRCGPGALAVGAPVQVCFERISDDIALPMFRLADGDSSAASHS